MHCLVAYDICCNKRLARVSKSLLDHGYRAQYSVFECHLSMPQLQRLWELLKSLIDPKQDRLVVYILDKQSSQRTLTAGTMVCHDKCLVYMVS